MAKFIKILAVLELRLLLESWEHTKDEMNTKMHFAAIIIWFMYLARGMTFFSKNIHFVFELC